MAASHSDGHAHATRVRSIEPTFCPHCGERLALQRKGDRERPACEACRYVWFPDPKVGVATIVVRDTALLLAELPPLAFASTRQVVAALRGRGHRHACTP